MNKKIYFLFFLLLIALAPIIASAACTTSVSNATLDSIMENVKGLARSLGGALVVIGFVVAGIIYVTAAGSTEKMGTAKKALIAAAIGAVIIAVSFAANIFTDIICDVIK